MKSVFPDNTEFNFRSWLTLDKQRVTRNTIDSRDIPVAIISLADQNERRRLLCERGIPTEWVYGHWPATDLRHQTPADVRATLTSDSYVYHPEWPSSVIGCALSHGKAAEWQVQQNYPLMLVLEDDAMPASADYLESLETITSTLLPSAIAGVSFVCHLGVRPEQMNSTYSRLVRTDRNRTLHYRLRLNSDPRPTLWRAHAYLISLAAAKKSARRDCQLLTVADDWCARASHGFFDRLYLATPRLFLQDEVINSTLDHTRDALTQSHDSIHRNFFNRIQSSIIFRSRMVMARLISRISITI